jgi:hypothetical protein
VGDRRAFDAQPGFERRVESLGKLDLIGKRDQRVTTGAAYEPVETWNPLGGGADEVIVRATINRMAEQEAAGVATPADAAADDGTPAPAGAADGDRRAVRSRLPAWLSCTFFTFATALPVATTIATFVLLTLTTSMSYLVASAVALFAGACSSLATLAAVNNGLCAAYALIPIVQEAMRMYLFWALVWLIKITAALFTLGPAVVKANHGLGAWVFVDQVHAWSLSEAMLRVYLLGCVWCLAFYIFVADTLGWYQLVLAVWGGVPRVVRSFQRFATGDRPRDCGAYARAGTALLTSPVRIYSLSPSLEQCGYRQALHADELAMA